MTAKLLFLRGGLDALYHTGAYRALAPLARGRGIIFTLHHVLPEACAAGERFDPNGILKITPRFLEQAIQSTRAAGLDIVDLNEAHRRVVTGEGRRFAVFTLDDGYRDNLEHALPVFARHLCPFTVFVTSGAIDRTARFWWVALERVIAGTCELAVTLGGRERRFACAGVAAKTAAFQAVYWPLREMGEAERMATIEHLAEAHGVSFEAILDELVLDWDELRRLAGHPLAAVGAHTVSHAMLSRLDEAEMRREMADGRDRIAEKLGQAPAHFAYPYGDADCAGPREFAAARDLGFATASTTRKGVLFGEHRDHLTALPRVSLNGEFQSRHYLELFLSGVPFALFNGFRRVDAA